MNQPNQTFEASMARLEQMPFKMVPSAPLLWKRRTSNEPTQSDL